MVIDKILRVIPNFIGIILIGVLNSSCKDEFKPSIPLDFEIPVNVYPQDEKISLGDTFILETKFPKVINDISGSIDHLFKIEDFEIGMGIYSLTQRDKSLIEQNGATGQMELLSQKGKITKISSEFAEIKFVELDNSIGFRTLIIPQIKGVYTLTLFQVDETYGKTKERFENDKMGGYFINKINYSVNTNGKTNYHLIFENTIPTDGKWLETAGYDYFKNGTFSFIVE
ncbi:hypothetical protein MMU05_04485 [Aquiflexum sp. AIY15W]|nr:hypothetical protein [Cognataquiflexum rubidum]